METSFVVVLISELKSALFTTLNLKTKDKNNLKNYVN